MPSISCSAESSTARGYALALHGEAQWNGVAILSRVGLEEVVSGIPDGPGFPHRRRVRCARAAAGSACTRVYVPNGREPDSEHYRYKLAWLEALRKTVASGAKMPWSVGT